MHSFQREGLEAELRPQDPQERNEATPTSAPRLTLLHSPSRPYGCFMPSRPASANPNSAGSGQNPASPIHGSWNLSYSTTYSMRPSNPPASPSLFKDYFKLTGKKASVFSNNFVWHDLKSHNFQIWSTNL